MQYNKTRAVEDDFRQMSAEDMEQRVNDFHATVRAEPATAPMGKEEVRRAMKRRGAARCPVRLGRLSIDVIIRYGKDLADLFHQFPDDIVVVTPYEWAIGYQPPDRKDYINPITAMMESTSWTDEWGTSWAHARGGVGASPTDHPLKDWHDLDAYLCERMPDPRAVGRLQASCQVIQSYRGSRYFAGAAYLGPFERLQCLRGMENLFDDLYSHPQQVHRLAKALTDYLVEFIRSWAELGVDAIWLTDDWGTQTSLMIAPGMWKEFFLPHYRLLAETAHQLGMDIVFHSDGNIISIIAGLIESGMDVIDPLQPGAIDLSQVLKDFGGKVAFSGVIDDQHLLNSHPEQIKETVCRTIELVGKRFGNAYIVGPSNVITPEVPFENICALFEACHNQ